MEDNIITGNKIIAEFMDDVYCPDGYYKENERMKYSVYPSCWQTPNHGVVLFLKYHSSWDWLHGAWEKFRDMRISLVDEGFHDKYSRHCMAISTAIHAYPIDVAFDRLVRAIKWYNKEQNVKVSDATEAK